MRAFEIFVNEKRLCVAGIGEDGVLDAGVDAVTGKGREDLRLRVGGLVGSTQEHLIWTEKRLKKDDEIRVRIIESASVDRPKKRQPRDPKEELKAQKRYVREMARKLGWTITAHR